MQCNVYDELTMANLIAVMKESFPELAVAFTLHKDNLPPEDQYCESFFTHIFCPFLEIFLNSDQPHPRLLGTRLFKYLEDMATSTDVEVSTLLAYTILEHLNHKELKVAELYMGPKTKEILKRVEEFWEKVEQWQAWFKAVDYNDISQVQLLLTQGINVNSTDHHGCTALHIAAYRDHQDIAELLLKHGADTDCKR